MSVLAKNINKHRTRLGLSFGKCAKQVGISKPQMWELEKEKATNPTLKTLRGLCKVFGTTLSQLTGF